MVREETNRVRLKINLDGGIVNDKQVVKSRTYSGILTDAASKDLHAAGKAIADTQDKDLLSIQRLVEVTLVEE